MRVVNIICLFVFVGAIFSAGCTETQKPVQPQTVLTIVVPEQTAPPQPAPTVPTPLSQAPVSANTIEIKNFAFTPQTITVKVNSIVRWDNYDAVTHRILFNDKTVAGSALLSPTQSFSQKFDRPGTYPYYCSIHPEMTGTVIVE